MSFGLLKQIALKQYVVTGVQWFTCAHAAPTLIVDLTVHGNRWSIC